MALSAREREVIKVDPKPMSEELRTRYEQKVLLPGEQWLSAHPDASLRPSAFWRKVQEDLALAFHLRCAYTALRIDYHGEIDHFISIHEDRARAYDWDNFRYCIGWINSKKQHLPSSKLLDPLLVEDDWFELSVPDLQLRITQYCPVELHERAEFMLEKLGLRKHERLIRCRAAYWAEYEKSGAEALPELEKYAPLVARAARKHLAENAP